jgi:hypothetical protein
MVNFGSLIPSFGIFNYIQMIFSYIQVIAVVAYKRTDWVQHKTTLLGSVKNATEIGGFCMP